jgi:hypothetical protein
MSHKRKHPEVEGRIAEAKSRFAELKHARARAVLEEVKLARGSSKKPSKLQPSHQARKVRWRLIHRIPLGVTAITPDMIKEACKIMNLSYNAFLRQDQVFGIMAYVYRKRTELRGDFTANRKTKAYLFPQNPAYRQPLDWNNSNLPSGLPEGFDVGM